jgi:octaprenyl-diphosphate synthase
MSTEASANLGAIYAPIEEELRQLDRFLDVEFRSSESYIFQILQHIARFRGKQIRPALLFLINRLAGGTISPELVKMGGVLELIHTATLVHDDLLDAAELRRNLDTVHRRWGERPAILIGDFIYSRAFQLSTEVPGMAQVLSATTHTICEGELLQIGNRHVPEISEETYFEIIRKKTAVLYAVSCELGGGFGGLESEHCDRLWTFGMELGTAFQIVDDCLDYIGKETVAGKSLGSDLHQCKVTLPLIYLRQQASPADAEWLCEALRKPLSGEAEERIHAMVRRTGVVADAFGQAESLIVSAKAALAEICQAGAPLEAPVRESLDLVADYILRRQK